MSIRFSRHAIRRLKERFRQHSHKVIALIESAVTTGGASPTSDGRWLAEGVVRGQRIRVIFVEHSPCEFTIVTVMWCP